MKYLIGAIIGAVIIIVIAVALFLKFIKEAMKGNF